MIILSLLMLMGCFVCSIMICHLKGTNNNNRITPAGPPRPDSEEQITEKDYDTFFPVFHNDQLSHKKFTDNLCSICIDYLTNGEDLREILICGHCFHSDCLVQWITSQKNCPNCRIILTKSKNKSEKSKNL